MEYRRQNAAFRYIVRNSTADIIVLIKRVSEGQALPCRELSLDVLGAISPLKTITKDDNEPLSPNKEIDEEGFMTPTKKCARPNYIPKKQMFRNISDILEG